MADNFLNKTGLQYYHNRIKTLFENKIETVKVNGTALVPDANKAVNIEIDDSVFVAKAFTTPVADIANAIEAGQTILVRYGNQTNLYQAVIAAGSAPDKSSATIVVATISTEQGVKMADIIEYTITAAGWTQSAIITVDEAVFVATINTTSASELAEAIAAKKVIYVTYGTNYPVEIATLTRVSGNTVTLHTSIFATENGKVYPYVTAYAVEGTTWSSMHGMGANASDVRAIQDVIPSDASAQNPLATQEWVDGKISVVYKPQGAVAFESLPALSASIEGYVYNVTNNFVTTADFIEGAGHAYPAGTNVVCIKHNNAYMWDCLYGVVDMSAYWTSAPGETNTLTAITTAEIDTIVES